MSEFNMRSALSDAVRDCPYLVMKAFTPLILFLSLIIGQNLFGQSPLVYVKIVFSFLLIFSFFLLSVSYLNTSLKHDEIGLFGLFVDGRFVRLVLSTVIATVFLSLIAVGLIIFIFIIFSIYGISEPISELFNLFKLGQSKVNHQSFFIFFAYLAMIFIVVWLGLRLFLFMPLSIDKKTINALNALKYSENGSSKLILGLIIAILPTLVGLLMLSHDIIILNGLEKSLFLFGLFFCVTWPIMCSFLTRFYLSRLDISDL